jgi:hypothetical protein
MCAQSHICTGTGLVPATSAPGLGSPLPLRPHDTSTRIDGGDVQVDGLGAGIDVHVARYGNDVSYHFARRTTCRTMLHHVAT